MNISDKTISKWERDLGCPDVSLLHELSEAASANIDKILLRNLDPNITDGGNMKKMQFYSCHTCGNIIAYVSYNRVHFVKLYPEQSNEVRFPKMYGGKKYYSCNQNGLWVNAG